MNNPSLPEGFEGEIDLPGAWLCVHYPLGLLVTVQETSRVDVELVDGRDPRPEDEQTNAAADTVA